MKVLIIEDEQISFRRLKRMLLKINPDMEVDGPLTTVSEVISKFSEEVKYDLIFSDIKLKDAEVFDAFRIISSKSMIVFTTAYDEFALKAFKSNGVDYLMKPIEMEELSNTMKKVELISGKETASISPIQDTSERKHYRERVVGYKGDELIFINVSDVLYFYLDNRHVQAKSKDGSVNTLHLTMNDLMNTLSPNVFFKLNRQCIVNICAIGSISLFFNSRLKVQIQGYEHPVFLSKEKSIELRDWLDR